MIPEIEFRYSDIYDQSYRRYLWVQEALKKEKREYPSVIEIERYILQIKKLWKKDGKKILKELEKISGLRWKEKKIICYLVGYCKPFSDPMTIPIYIGNKTRFIDVLIHELIHQLFCQEGNIKKADNAWKYIFKKYKEESFKTKIHIPLHAIHSHIYLNFYNESRLRRDIDIMKTKPDYARSWAVVENGHKNIIKEFTKRVKNKNI